jgi:hypothetical protein
MTLIVGMSGPTSPQDAEAPEAPAAAAEPSEAAKELSTLAESMAKVENYEFSSQSETEGGGFGRGGVDGGRSGEDAPPAVLKGTFKKGYPMKLAMGETVIYKDGGQVVHKNEEGAWAVLDREAMFRRGGRGGGGRGDRGEGRGGRGEGGGERGGDGERSGEGEQGERRGGGMDMRAMMQVMSASAPHLLFDGIGEKVSDVVKEEKDGVVVYSGSLTEKGLESGSASPFGRGGRGGGRGGDMKTVGTFQIETKGPMITKVVIKTTISGSFGERSFESTTTRTVQLDKVGEAELEVPDEVLAQFEI